MNLCLLLQLLDLLASNRSLLVDLNFLFSDNFNQLHHAIVLWWRWWWLLWVIFKSENKFVCRKRPNLRWSHVIIIMIIWVTNRHCLRVHDRLRLSRFSRLGKIEFDRLFRTIQLS